MEKKYKTLLFDYDGTLLDTEVMKQYADIKKRHKRYTKEWSQDQKEYLSQLPHLSKSSTSSKIPLYRYSFSYFWSQQVYRSQTFCEFGDYNIGRGGDLQLFLAEPVFRTAVHHTVLKTEAEVVHRLAQYRRRGPFGIEIGIAAGEGREYL